MADKREQAAKAVLNAEVAKNKAKAEEVAKKRKLRSQPPRLPKKLQGR